MTDSNNCVNIEELLDAFLDGELQPDERAAVEQHIAACSKCARQLKESERMIKELKSIPVKTSSREIDFSFLNEDAAERPVVSEQCKPINELLDAYHDGELAEDEKKSVTEHLASCQACTNALAQIQQLVLGIKSMPMSMPSRDIVESLNFDQYEKKSNVIPFSRKFGIGIGAVAAAAVALVFAFNSGHAPANSGANLANNNAPKTPVVQEEKQETPAIASNNTEVKTPEQQNENLEEVQSQSSENIAENLPELKNGKGDAARRPSGESGLLASKPADNTATVRQEVLKIEPQKQSGTLNEVATIPDSGSMLGADALGIGTDEDGLYDIKI